MGWGQTGKEADLQKGCDDGPLGQEVEHGSVACLCGNESQPHTGFY